MALVNEKEMMNKQSGEELSDNDLKNVVGGLVGGDTYGNVMIQPIGSATYGLISGKWITVNTAEGYKFGQFVEPVQVVKNGQTVDGCKVSIPISYGSSNKEVDVALSDVLSYNTN